MIDGEKFKKDIQCELKNLEDIPFKLTDMSMMIYSDELNTMFHEIINNLDENKTNQFIDEWSTELISYAYDSTGFLKVVLERPADLTLRNIHYKLRVGILQTYVCLCEFARNQKIFVEPDKGILW